MHRRHFLAAALAASWALGTRAQTPVSDAWTRLEAAAKGQTVYLNAWAGSERINAYLQWAANELARRFGVKLEHVKITDATQTQPAHRYTASIEVTPTHSVPEPVTVT